MIGLSLNLKKTTSFRFRAKLLLISLEICFGILVIRLIYIQVIQRDEFLSLLAQQPQSAELLRLNRGKIYDRNFKELAVNVDMVSVYADSKVVQTPQRAQRAQRASKIVSEVLNLQKDEVLKKLESQKRFVWLQRKVDYGVAQKLKQQLEIEKIKGINFRPDEKRFYPKGRLACHLLGFVGLDNVGLEGIEKFYESEISSSDSSGVKELVRPAAGAGKRNRKGISFDYYFYSLKGASGSSNGLVLTIDEVIQQLVEYELEAACKKWSAKSGSAIVMNPKSGEVLALANYPSYDLNRFSESEPQLMRNRAVMDMYEPGSAFKIAVAAAAIEENVVNPNTKIFCENGEYSYAAQVIHDTHKSGWLSFREVLAESSNIGFVKVSQLLGKDRLYKRLKAFGLSEKTGVDLLSEASGYLPPVKAWKPQLMASISFGQGLSVTPLQMLCALNAIANRGLIMRPFVLKEVVDSHKNRLKFSQSTPIRKPISEVTASTLTDILVHVVEAGTGKAAQLPGYKVAGKTGTSQKALKNLGYVSGKYVSSFVGFLPADEPKVSIIVVIDEPKGEYLSAKVAAPLWKKIAEGTIQYMQRTQLAYGK